MTQKIKYKEWCSISIWSLDRIEKYVKEKDGDYSDLDFETTYYKIFGEFYYCGLVLDGVLFLTEQDLLEIVCKTDSSFNILKSVHAYFFQHLQYSLGILRRIDFMAKHFASIYAEDDDEDNDDVFLFLKINPDNFSQIQKSRNRSVDSLLIEYLLLKNLLESKGGRDAVSQNPEELESLYENILLLEDKILDKFYLPKLIQFREILFDFKFFRDIKKIKIQIKKNTEQYLASSPQSPIKLLENAKINDQKTYDILPELGFEDTIVSMFYFEECYKKGLMDAQELINILTLINPVISKKMNNFRAYTKENNYKEESLKIFKELKKKQIPFINEFANYNPSYPY